MFLASLDDQLQAQTLYWGAVIIGVSVAGFAGIMLFKHFWKRNEASNDDVGFSLSELKAMRDRGEITIQEYEQTRANVIAKVKQRAAEPRKPKRTREQPGPSDLAE